MAQVMPTIFIPLDRLAGCLTAKGQNKNHSKLAWRCRTHSLTKTDSDTYGTSLEISTNGTMDGREQLFSFKKRKDKPPIKARLVSLNDVYQNFLELDAAFDPQVHTNGSKHRHAFASFLNERSWHVKWSQFLNESTLWPNKDSPHYPSRRNDELIERLRQAYKRDPPISSRT